MPSILSKIQLGWSNTKDWITTFWQWAKSFARGWFVRVLFGSFVGSSLLGILNSCAIYKYTYAHGCRLPVEGVPYLNLSVSLLLFCLATLCASLAAACFASLSILAYCFHLVLHQTFSMLKLLDVGRFKDVGELISYYSSLTIRLRNGVPVLAGPGDSDAGPTQVERLVLALLFAGLILFVAAGSIWINPTSIEKVGPLVVTVLGIVFIYVTVCVVDWMIWAWTVIAGLIGVGLVVSALFNNTTYTSFLRAARFGGGTRVTVEEKGPDDSRIAHDGYLLLETNRVYMLYDSSNEQIVEVPKSECTLTQYARNASHKLPEYKFEWPHE